MKKKTILAFFSDNQIFLCFKHDVMTKEGFPGGSVVKNLPSNVTDVRDAGSVPGSGRSPGGGHGNALQYSYLENPIGRGA